VGDEDLVREGADELIALPRERCCHPGVCGYRWKGREDEQPAILEAWLEFRLHAHPDDASGWHPDDGLTATEKDAEALPLHDRVKPANKNLAIVTHLRDGIEGLQDDGAWTLGRAEEADLRTFEMLDWTN
jgi:hypothetical protein